MPDAKRTTLTVPGISCPKCEERLALALDHLPGLTLLGVDYVRGEVEVRVDGPGEDALAEARRRIEAIGYAVEGAS